MKVKSLLRELGAAKRTEENVVTIVLLYYVSCV